MTQIPTDMDSELSDTLLTKADALIRRNRPDGVGLESEELPLLTEIIEDIPELTEQVFNPTDTNLREERSTAHAFDIGYEQTTVAFPAAARSSGTSFGMLQTQPAETPATEVTAISREQVDILILDAIQRTRDELLRKQGDAIQEAVERARQQTQAPFAQQIEQFHKEARAERERAVQEAIEATRLENRAMQTRAVQAAFEQGRDDGLANQQTYLNDVRMEAAEAATMQISEHLIQLDAYIAQALDGWIAQELPQILATELDSMVDRIKVQTAAHMRATLLPEISDKLSAILDATLHRQP